MSFLTKVQFFYMFIDFNSSTSLHLTPKRKLILSLIIFTLNLYFKNFNDWLLYLQQDVNEIINKTFQVGDQFRFKNRNFLFTYFKKILKVLRIKALN